MPPTIRDRRTYQRHSRSCCWLFCNPFKKFIRGRESNQEPIPTISNYPAIYTHPVTIQNALISVNEDRLTSKIYFIGRPSRSELSPGSELESTLWYNNIKYSADIVCCAEDIKYLQWNNLVGKKVRIITSIDGYNFLKGPEYRQFKLKLMQPTLGKLNSRFVIVDNRLLVIGNICACGDVIDLHIRIGCKKTIEQFQTEFEYLYNNAFSFSKVKVNTAIDNRVAKKPAPKPGQDIKIFIFHDSKMNDQYRRERSSLGYEIKETTVQSMKVWIQATQKKLDICVYRFCSQELANCVLALSKRDRKIRIITDGNESELDATEKDTNKIPMLERSDNIEVRYLGTPKPRGSLMHHKFAVRDDESLLIGSFNWTNQAEKHNFESVLMINRRETATKFKEEFSTLWNMAKRKKSCSS